MPDFVEVNPKRCLGYMAPTCPVVLVSTVDAAGHPNVAPFGYATVAADDPPTLLISMHKKGDTFRNVQASGTFVAAYLPPQYASAIYATGDPIPSEISEFDYADLTPLPARQVTAPLIAEAAVNLELKVLWQQEVGQQYVVAGEVIAAHLTPELAEIEGKLRRLKVPGVYFPTSGYYFEPGPMQQVSPIKKG